MGKVINFKNIKKKMKKEKEKRYDFDLIIEQNREKMKKIQKERNEINKKVLEIYDLK